MYIHLRIRNADARFIEAVFDILQHRIARLPVVFLLRPEFHNKDNTAVCQFVYVDCDLPLRKHGFLEKFCIPAPVIGGLLFAILTCLCYVTGIAEFSFDDTLREVCMVFFFTSVGFQANLKVLKSGGTAMAVFLGLVVALIICQNLLAVGLSHVLHFRLSGI